MKMSNIILKKRKIPDINSVKITYEAFKKMNFYAKIVSEIIGKDIECMGALINHANRKDNVARDVYLWKEQNIYSSQADTDYLLDPFYATKGKGLEVVGVWHSHGSIPVFHSATDEDFLKTMYKFVRNRLVTGEKEIGIEKIVDGEVLRLFEDGSYKELRIKGNIEDIKYISREEYNVLNSIVINKNSYCGGYSNPLPRRDYDAEVWLGLNRGSSEKNVEKRVQNVNLELLDENNNIQLDEEELVKEVGEKVKSQGRYLKELPNYSKILEKYKKESPQEIKPDIQNEVQKQELCGNHKINYSLSYASKLEEICKSLNNYQDPVSKMITELSDIYSGKKYRLWKKRSVESYKILKQLKKRKLSSRHKKALDLIKDAIRSNKYLKKRYPLMFKDVQRKLEINSNSYCTLAYLKDLLVYSLFKSRKKKDAVTLESILKDVNNGKIIHKDSLEKAIKNYDKEKIKRTFKKIAKYACVAALSAALAIFPAKYSTKNTTLSKPTIVYPVKKGDNLWSITKDYLQKEGIQPNDKLVYKIVDKVAEENGKGKQAEYQIGKQEKKNPHHIKPGDKIKLSKKVLKFAKEGGKK